MSEQVYSAEPFEKAARPAFWKGLIFLVVLAAVVGILGLFVIQNRSLEGPLVPTERPIPISVETVEVNLTSGFSAEEKFTGLVEARRSSQLGFAGGGRIAAIFVDVGDRVETGERLAVLDTRGLQAQLVSAEAMIVEARAAHALAESTVQRQIALLEKGHVSQQRVDEARAQASTALARINAASANADALRVQIELASITAPFAGTVTARMADEGAIAGGGRPIFELVESGNLEARIGVTADIAASLEIGQAYNLFFEGAVTKATLRSMTGVIDTSNRTVTTVFDILESESVPAGAVVRLGMERRIDKPGLWLPISALSESDRGLWAVYSARPQAEGWIAETGIVEIIHQEGDRVFVRGALRDGDYVIIDGLQRITPGQPIEPVEVNMLDQVANTGSQR